MQLRPNRAPQSSSPCRDWIKAFSDGQANEKAMRDYHLPVDKMGAGYYELILNAVVAPEVGWSPLAAPPLLIRGDISTCYLPSHPQSSWTAIRQANQPAVTHALQPVDANSVPPSDAKTKKGKTEEQKATDNRRKSHLRKYVCCALDV